MGLSARYLTLFHWKERRYCSTGSTDSQQRLVGELGHARTVVDGLLLGDLLLVAVEDAAQRVSNLVHNLLAGRVELGEVVGLLHEGIEGADLEVGQAEGIGGADVVGDGGAQRGEGLFTVVGRRYRRGQRHQQVFGEFRHGAGGGRQGARAEGVAGAGQTGVGMTMQAVVVVLLQLSAKLP